MGKIIFLDIDGTLCNDAGLVPDSAKEAIIHAYERGHRFYLCTGRSKAEISDEVLALPISGIIGAGGGYCEIDGEVIFHHVFDSAELKKMIRFLEGHQIEYYLESNQGLFASAKLRERLIQLSLGDSAEESEEGQKKIAAIQWFLDLLIEDSSLIDYEDVNKLSFINHSVPYEVIHEEYDGDFHMLRSTVPAFGPDSGEIGLKNINKKTAIEMVLEKIQRSKEDCLAFGDGNNDLVMFEAVGVGIAMGNAKDELKAAADEITLTHDEGGIAHILAKLN
ncbi:Cof-type HAD-IIB family hydrolase [Enterococcus sp. AZ196]|uniref:Cof-type HAD-IIB family hydrolase n=1 Tax=Enterococcus sp. AZ196 TaxID=2774659 RepID=UPI003D2D1C8C